MIAEEKKCSSCCWVWDAMGQPLTCTLERDPAYCEGPKKSEEVTDEGTNNNDQSSRR
jgi:hypothetical protein